MQKHMFVADVFYLLQIFLLLLEPSLGSLALLQGHKQPSPLRARVQALSTAHVSCSRAPPRVARRWVRRCLEAAASSCKRKKRKPHE